MLLHLAMGGEASASEVVGAVLGYNNTAFIRGPKRRMFGYVSSFAFRCCVHT
jgi:hypothetical protein